MTPGKLELPGPARGKGPTMQRRDAKADGSHPEAPKEKMPRHRPRSHPDAKTQRTIARPLRDWRSRRAAAFGSDVAGGPRAEEVALETRQLGIQDFQARIQDLLAHEDYTGAAALKETMERETAVREAEQRTDGEQKERLGDRVPEASIATPQKQAQLDATTDGAEGRAATGTGSPGADKGSA